MANSDHQQLPLSRLLPDWGWVRLPSALNLLTRGGGEIPKSTKCQNLTNLLLVLSGSNTNGLSYFRFLRCFLPSIRIDYIWLVGQKLLVLVANPRNFCKPCLTNKRFNLSWTNQIVLKKSINHPPMWGGYINHCELQWSCFYLTEVSEWKLIFCLQIFQKNCWPKYTVKLHSNPIFRSGQTVSYERHLNSCQLFLLACGIQHKFLLLCIPIVVQSFRFDICQKKIQMNCQGHRKGLDNAEN